MDKSAGHLIDTPKEWYVSRDREAYIALRPTAAGGRFLFPGDVAPALPSEGSLARGEFAALPIWPGVLGLTRVLLEREQILEAYLALFAARDERRTGSTDSGDKLIGQCLVTADQIQKARDFLAYQKDQRPPEGGRSVWMMSTENCDRSTCHRHCQGDRAGLGG